MEAAWFPTLSVGGSIALIEASQGDQIMLEFCESSVVPGVDCGRKRSFSSVPGRGGGCKETCDIIAGGVTRKTRMFSEYALHYKTQMVSSAFQLLQKRIGPWVFIIPLLLPGGESRYISFFPKIRIPLQ